MEEAERPWLCLSHSLKLLSCQTNQIFDDKVSNWLLSVSLTLFLPLINKHGQVHAMLMCGV